jgi:hypothetical protein
MPALSQAFDAVALAELRLQVENFDYPAALDSVRAMQAQL